MCKDECQALFFLNKTPIFFVFDRLDRKNNLQNILPICFHLGPLGVSTTNSDKLVFFLQKKNSLPQISGIWLKFVCQLPKDVLLELTGKNYIWVKFIRIDIMPKGDHFFLNHCFFMQSHNMPLKKIKNHIWVVIWGFAVLEPSIKIKF